MLAQCSRRALFGLLDNFYIRIIPQNAAELATNASYSTNSISAASAATAQSSSTIPNDGLTLNHFINRSRKDSTTTTISTATNTTNASLGSVFIETYGCQMNTNDSEVVTSVLLSAGYTTALSAETADIVLLNTCAIRDNAESKIWKRLGYFKNMKLNRKNLATVANRQKVAAAAAAAAEFESDVSLQNSSSNSTITNSTPITNSPSTGPVVGVLGCMAERLKIKLLESDRLVDIVAGPDAYRDLPRLIHIVDGGVSTEKNRKFRTIVDISGSKTTLPAASRPRKINSSLPDTASKQQDYENEGDSSNSLYNAAINVQLSLDETYADVVPFRQAGAQSVFLSIMRGCNNMCSFCVVPFTRGRERSRPRHSILDEVKMLSDQGVKEITLLGQNVNSYADFSSTNPTSSTFPVSMDNNTNNEFDIHYAKGFQSVYRPCRQGAVTFAELLDSVADVNPEIRIRFTSPHPKDFSDEVLHVLRSRDNVCKSLHMPAQSGSSTVLERMKRVYTREAYDALVEKIREFIPGTTLSTDMIAGFCEETETEHEESVDLLQKVKYDIAFLFAYSEREKTHAARKYEDNVPQEVKIRRVTELINAYRQGVYSKAKEEIGRRHLVLVQGKSRKNENQLTGRTDTFKRVVFEDCPMPFEYTPSSVGGGASPTVHAQPGDYVAVQVIEATGGTLHAVPLGRTSITQFVGVHGSVIPLQTF